MSREQQVQTLGSLYLLHKSHSAQLQAVGYTKTEAFWLRFGCLPFLPWAEYSEDQLRLTEVLRLHLGIYLYDTDDDLTPEAIPAFLELLADRYRMATDIAVVADTFQRKGQLGRFALPGEHDITRTIRAASLVLHTIVAWEQQEGQDRLVCPCGADQPCFVLRMTATAVDWEEGPTMQLEDTFFQCRVHLPSPR